MTERLSGHLATVSGSGEILDRRPIKLAGFELRARSAVPVGRPTFDQTTAALEFAGAAHEASPYWVGDILNYADSREDWKERVDQLKSITGLAHQTLINRAYIARHVDTEARELAPSLAHAAEVAPLEKHEQKKFLKKARTEGWTRLELGKNIRATHRPRIIEGQAELVGTYRVIYADPPWKYGDRQPSGKGAEDHYPPMTIPELCKLPVEAHARRHAVLFMWTTAPFLLLKPGPREVLEAWGFEYKTCMVWDKVRGIFGHYVRAHHELLLIATRGSCLPDAPTPQPDSVQVIRRDGEHSEKPEEFRKIITKLYTRGPYLELFGRRKVEGWTVFGNDARLWAEEVQA